MKSLLPLILGVALLAHCSGPATTATTIDIGSVRSEELNNPLQGCQQQRCVRIYCSETFSERDTLEDGIMLTDVAMTDRLWKDVCAVLRMKPTVLLTMDSPIYVAFVGESGEVLCIAVSDSMSETFHIADGSVKNGKYNFKPGAFKWRPVRNGEMVRVASKDHEIYYGVPAERTIRFLRGILDARAAAEERLKGEPR